MKGGGVATNKLIYFYLCLGEWGQVEDPHSGMVQAQ